VNLERVAGATTDMQHLIHQGFTYFHASYWVGANAILRVRALDAIKETDTERGFPIARYIQDRTVIEDTESTIDLLQKGWEVYNYLEQLAFSATPPDFGALIIQRRRWANGGLIIFPKLLRYLWGGPHAFVRRATETFVRAHYLVSYVGVPV
jgi:cellulose synthase (UDP-forming)